MSDENEVLCPLAIIGGVPTTYVNNARYLVSGLDIRLYFAQTVPTEMPSTPADAQKKSEVDVRIEDQVCLVVAPEFVKSLAEMLLQAVHTYEESFGKLRPGAATLATPPTPVAEPAPSAPAEPTKRQP